MNLRKLLLSTTSPVAIAAGMSQFSSPREAEPVYLDDEKRLRVNVEESARCYPDGSRFIIDEALDPRFHVAIVPPDTERYLRAQLAKPPRSA